MFKEFSLVIYDLVYLMNYYCVLANGGDYLRTILLKFGNKFSTNG